MFPLVSGFAQYLTNLEIIKEMVHLPCEEKLKDLGLFRLERHPRGDMIEVD